MKLPRDISGHELAASLTRLGYEIDHQTGSHIRLTTIRNGEHHVTVPAHDPLRVGTLAAVLQTIREHHNMNRNELLNILFG